MPASTRKTRPSDGSRESTTQNGQRDMVKERKKIRQAMKAKLEAPVPDSDLKEERERKAMRDRLRPASSQM